MIRKDALTQRLCRDLVGTPQAVLLGLVSEPGMCSDDEQGAWRFHAPRLGLLDYTGLRSFLDASDRRVMVPRFVSGSGKSMALRALRLGVRLFLGVFPAHRGLHRPSTPYFDFAGTPHASAT